MRFYIEDAFTNALFSGNTAGTVILGKGDTFPSEEVMLKTAAELRYSETAFVMRLDSIDGKKAFQIRYFTPAAEVDLCGHATIGSFGALYREGLVSDGDSCIIKTLAGELEVCINGGTVMMEMAQPRLLQTLSGDVQMAELSAILGVEIRDIIYPPQLVSTGLPDIIVMLSTRQLLNGLKPDFAAMTELSRKYSAVGIHAAALCEDGSCTAYCRNFAPLYEIDEEAATGTANGALTSYLYELGIIKAGERNTFVQGEAMGRASKIMSVIEPCGKDVKISVGGDFAILASGEIY